jgi:hypothetical protein
MAVKQAAEEHALGTWAGASCLGRLAGASVWGGWADEWCDMWQMYPMKSVRVGGQDGCQASG